jgi:hypothetical protein
VAAFESTKSPNCELQYQSSSRKTPILRLVSGGSAFISFGRCPRPALVTAKLTADDTDEPLNAAVGHILDCLDSLPRRPDAAYDSLYKVIDQTAGVFAQPSTPRMRATVNALFAANPGEWTQISELLSSNMPQQTADYSASRILDCYVQDPPHTDKFKRRAARSLGKQRYEKFRNNFLVTNPQNAALYDLPYHSRRNARRLIRMLFQQSAPMPPKAAATANAPSTLDRSVSANLLS